MKALRRCRNNLEADNVVLIDVETYHLNHVIDLDLLENLTKKQGGGSSGLTNDKNRPLKTYIYIDDDDIPNETNFENVASSSRRYDSDTQFDQENVTPVKLSKGKRTYGLSTQSDDDDDDDDEDENVDCEFMEDFEGKLREQWERAHMKRKGDVDNDDDDGTNVDKNKQKTSDEEKGKSPVGNDDADIIMEDRGDFDDIPCTSNQEKNDSVSDDVSVDDSIINQLEKHKETEEYKRALEQELSARQMVIKMQAEEAQKQRRLAKRKKAESMRLLDMERRQKLRVEEIRETEKKDKENMSLKEEYRTEVREELQKLKVMCPDMASLLRGLGVKVGDGACPPLPHEVRVACKRALVSFHPDRASGSDMRQQIEAEEKFKLISDMKDKFSL